MNTIRTFFPNQDTYSQFSKKEQGRLSPPPLVVPLYYFVLRNSGLLVSSLQKPTTLVTKIQNVKFQSRFDTHYK